jgi:hypothetical protein
MDDAPVHADPAVGVGQPAAAGAQPPGAHAPHAAIPVNQPAGYHIPVVPLEPAVYAAAAALPAGRILLSGMPTITVSSPPNPEAVRIALEKLTEWRSMTHQVAVLPMSKLLRVASVSNEVDIWVSRYNRAYPEATDDDIVNAFLERFAPEVRSRATIARQKLLSGQVRMTTGMSVAAYIATFSDLCSEAGNISEPDQIALFQMGLTDELRVACSVDNNAKEFTSFSAVRAHAVGEETKQLVRTSLATSSRAGTAVRSGPAVLNSVHKRMQEMEPTSTPPAKRPCYAEAVRSNRRPTAAPVSAPRANRGPSSSTVRRPPRTLPQRSQQQRPRQQRPQPQHNPLELTRFKDLDGKRINFATYQAMLRGNVCFNCFEPGHHSRECRAPPKPYPDEPRPA